MILWHLGLACLIVYVTLGRRRIDYRFILVGAVLPDLLDLGARRHAHSLTALLLVTVIVIVFLRDERRLAWFGIPVGWLLHLVGDAMWESPRTFLWPAFGTSFEGAREPYSMEVLLSPLEHAGVWGMELVGALILAWFWVAFRLGHEGRFGLFLRDGYLRP